MSRTDQEFKAEIFRRSEAYFRRRQKRRKMLVSVAVCTVLALGVTRLAVPYMASGGAAPVNEAEAPMAMEDRFYSYTAAPGAVAPESVAGSTEAAMKQEERRRMVLIDGVLYLDTGDTAEGVRKCGTFDGEITSRVGDGEIPGEDDQSNFAVGNGYQYGSKDGTVEVRIDGIWCIFATEELLEELQSAQ